MLKIVGSFFAAFVVSLLANKLGVNFMYVIVLGLGSLSLGLLFTSLNLLSDLKKAKAVK